MWRRHILVLLVAMMLGLLSMARVAQAQDEAEPDKEQPAEPEFQMTDQQFEQWIFGKDLGAAKSISKLASIGRSIGPIRCTGSRRVRRRSWRLPAGAT